MLAFQTRRTPLPNARESSVHVVHRERFIRGGQGGASLEVADAWVDGRTGGVRLIGRSTLPLARMFVGPNGVEVYGARSGDTLEVVLRAGSGESEDSTETRRV